MTTNEEEQQLLENLKKEIYKVKPDASIRVKICCNELIIRINETLIEVGNERIAELNKAINN